MSQDFSTDEVYLGSENSGMHNITNPIKKEGVTSILKPSPMKKNLSLSGASFIDDETNLEERVAELQKRNTELLKIIANYRDSKTYLNELQAEVEKLNRELALSKAASPKFSRVEFDEFRTYQQRIIDLETRNRELEESLKRVKFNNEMVNQSNDEIIALKSKNKELEFQLECMTKQFHNLKQQYKGISNNMSRDKKKIEELNNLIKKKDTELESLKNDQLKAKSTEGCDDLLKKVDELTLKSYKSECEAQKVNLKLSKINNDMSLQAKDYETRIREKDSLIDRLKEKLRALDQNGEEMSRAKEIISALKDEVKAKDDQLKTADRRIDNLKGVITQLEQENIDIRTQINVQNDKDEKINRLVKKNDTLERMNRELIDNQQREKVNCKTSIDFIKAEMNDKVRYLEATVTDLNETIERLTFERDQLKKQTHSDELASLHTKIEKSIALNNDIHNEMIDLRNKSPKCEVYQSKYPTYSSTYVSSGKFQLVHCSSFNTRSFETMTLFQYPTLDKYNNNISLKLEDMGHQMEVLRKQILEKDARITALHNELLEAKKSDNLIEKMDTELIKKRLKQSLNVLHTHVSSKASIPELVERLYAMVSSSISIPVEIIINELRCAHSKAPYTRDGALVTLNAAKKKVSKLSRLEKKYERALDIISTLKEVVDIGMDDQILSHVRELFSE